MARARSRDFPRSRRVEEQLQRILSDVIRRDLQDPRIRLVVITSVRVSRDLSVAWISFGLLQGAAAEAEQAADGLRNAAGFLRHRLAEELATRTVPELRFELDRSSEQGRRLDALIDSGLAPAADNQAVPGEDPT